MSVHSHRLVHRDLTVPTTTTSTTSGGSMRSSSGRDTVEILGASWVDVVMVQSSSGGRRLAEDRGLIGRGRREGWRVRGLLVLCWLL